MRYFEITFPIPLVLLLAYGCCSPHMDDIVRVSIAQHTRHPFDLRCVPYAVEIDYEEGMSLSPSLPVDFFIIVENRSKDAVCFDSEAFSIGYENLSLLIQTTGESTCIVKKRNPVWSRNIPEVDILPPGEIMAIPVCLDSAIWEGLPEFEKGSSVQIGAIIDVGYILSQDKEVVSRIGPLQSRFHNIAIHDTRKTNWMAIHYEQEMARIKRGDIP